MDESDGWPKRKQLKRSLLKKYWGTEKVKDLITLLSSMATQRKAAEHDVILLRDFENAHGHKPREIRVINVLLEKGGENLVPVFKDPRQGHTFH